MRGTVVKAVSGFYYLEVSGGLAISESGASEAYEERHIYECKARGVFKNKGVDILVGDEAEFENGVITAVLPRRNSLARPPVANVETLVIVMAAAEPEPSFELLDRFLAAAEENAEELTLCINKCDIAGKALLDKFSAVYGSVYPLHFVSCRLGEGIDALRAALAGKQAALAGPSGVGKSTLTNLLLKREASETGAISRKSLRGKNTTRHTELFRGDGFRLFDTPGFTSFEAELRCGEAGLAELFPEFRDWLGQCRFGDCRHMNEPGCALHSALDEGRISESRYASYRAMYQSLLENKRY